MLKISETRNVSGQVMIGEGENSKQVAYLNASVSKDGNVNINKSIQDCRMAAHNIVPVQIHSPADIFRNINAICPPFIAIRKSPIIRKLL